MSERRFGLFGRRKSKVSGLVTATPSLIEAIQLFDGSLASYGSVYRKLAPVRTVVDFIAGGVSTTPIKVYRRTETGRPEARDHGLAVLLRHPNPELTTRKLIWGTVADLALYGNAYWRKVETGRLRSVVPLPPFRVTPKGGDLLSPAAYDIYAVQGGGPQRVSRDEIVHFRFYDPEDRRVGSSKLESLKNILLEEVEASRDRRGFWKRSARVEGWLERPAEAGVLSDVGYNRMMQSVENLHSGSEGKRIGMLEEGTTFNPAGWSPKDSEFVQGRQFVLEATARVFGIPLSLLGLTETATFASQREFRKQLYTEVLPDWFELIQSEIELQLLPWFAEVEDIYAEFQVEAKLRGDFIDQGTLLFQATGRPYQTVAETRKLLNLPGRDEPDDDKLVIPVGPNTALEGAEVAPALAPVSSLPAARAASTLTDFFARQERSVVARAGAGKAFDRERWDRELTSIIGSKALAERINLETELQLSEADDPHEVFERARSVRAAQIAYDLTPAQEA